MGGGVWTAQSFASYSTALGRGVDKDGALKGSYTAQELFKNRSINEKLNPYNVVRECCDSEEHPNTIPVILALDVTGSMGSGAVEVAKKLNTIMTDLYAKVKDVEFMVMGIGDLSYDDSPIQASQFESDIRIAEQLDQIYFEGGGGGNSFESYTSAWYFGLNNCKLDCWKRGKKGIIITLGDELLNPYLPVRQLRATLGCNEQGDIETSELYKEASQKYDIFHISIDDYPTSYRRRKESIDQSWKKMLGQNYMISTIENLPSKIVEIVTSLAKEEGDIVTNNTGISW